MPSLVERHFSDGVQSFEDFENSETWWVGKGEDRFCRVFMSGYFGTRQRKGSSATYGIKGLQGNVGFVGFLRQERAREEFRMLFVRVWKRPHELTSWRPFLDSSWTPERPFQRRRRL